MLATGAGFLVLVKEAEAELLVESARFLLDCLGAELQGKFCGTIKRVLANLKSKSWKSMWGCFISIFRIAEQSQGCEDQTECSSKEQMASFNTQ